jgi:hypothetical protein
VEYVKAAQEIFKTLFPTYGIGEAHYEHDRRPVWPVVVLLSLFVLVIGLIGITLFKNLK